MYALHDYYLFQTGQSLPWWLWLILFLIVVSLVVWALTRSSSSTQSISQPHLGEEHAEGTQAGRPRTGTSEELEDADMARSSILAGSTGTQDEQTAEAPVDLEIHPDDLTIIEGIGPKIKQILADAGITRFDQLAQSRVDDLEQIMRDAKLRIANPKTWPSQARLAAVGEWDKLASYQERLNAGRE